MSQMGKFTVAGGGGPGDVTTITGNAGGAVSPTLGNLDILGAGNIFTTGNPGTSTLTITLVGTINHALQIGNASGSLTSLAVAANGQIPIGSAGADPVIANLTAGAGISIANGAGSITIAHLGTNFAWTDVLGAAQAMAVNNGYVADNNVLVTLTLPAVAAFGSIIKVVGKGTGLWSIAQNAGQVIHFGAFNTTVGITGSLTANQRYDCVELVCTTANTDFTVSSVMGNLTPA